MDTAMDENELITSLSIESGRCIERGFWLRKLIQADIDIVLINEIFMESINSGHDELKLISENIKEKLNERY